MQRDRECLKQLTLRKEVKQNSLSSKLLAWKNVPCPGRHLVVPIIHFLGCLGCSRAQQKHSGCVFHSWFYIGALADVRSTAALSSLGCWHQQQLPLAYSYVLHLLTQKPVRSPWHGELEFWGQCSPQVSGKGTNETMTSSFQLKELERFMVGTQTPCGLHICTSNWRYPGTH